MTEQIMKILPAKKLRSVDIKNVKLLADAYDLGIVQGHNDCVDLSYAAIEKANLVRCPTEKEILDCISAVCQCSSCVTCRESAKAILALLRGEK